MLDVWSVKADRLEFECRMAEEYCLKVKRKKQKSKKAKKHDEIHLIHHNNIIIIIR